MPPESLVAGSSGLLPSIGLEASGQQRAGGTHGARPSANTRGKRLFDVFGASLALLMLLPLMIAAAVAIRVESSGPVLFRQRRTGLDQRAFTILKFRTMKVGHEQDVAQARRSDPRITRVGALLRRSSLDELPQLMNVLAGEMSLIGPRPHALSHDEQYRQSVGHYGLRHTVRPGMTGWAQVNGLRGETRDLAQMAARVDHDLWYIDKRSLALDVKILYRTVFEVLKFDAV